MIKSQNYEIQVISMTLKIIRNHALINHNDSEKVKIMR